MSVKNINGLRYGPVVVGNAGNTITVGEAGSVVQGKYVSGVPEAAISENGAHPASLHDNSYVIDGRLIDSSCGIYATGDRDAVRIGATGHIYGGQYGVLLLGSDTILVNAGEIIAGHSGYGVEMWQGVRSHIDNTGLISGEYGVVVQGDGDNVVNERGGVITGNYFAVGQTNFFEGEVKVVNHGLLIGSSGTAVETFSMTLNLVNDGIIKGDVDFGIAGGTLDNRGGTIKGAINGGAGDDTIIVDNARYHLVEKPDNGTDTVKSTVSYTLDANVERLVLIGKADTNGLGTDGDNVLLGNGGANTLGGLGGADTLIGGKGSDMLSGGDGADVFAFATGFGKDTVADFSATDGDSIYLGGWKAIGDFNTLLGHASDHGHDVWISAGNDTLVIDHQHKADLVASDFFWDVE